MSDAVKLGSNGRAPGGRFAEGNKMAAGNPVNRRMAELRRQVLESETPERVAEVVARMRDLAIGGDTAAARIYLEHTLGRAPQSIELSGAVQPLVDREQQLAMLADPDAIALACELDERLARST